ncbi:hypothetical protein RSOLAG22IIIB_12791 [Rhizoctonia solani]|uniref:Uncharacterized protein n=1 Tax=Rhizoctonia solani TaxID=456999 RepID=A0A0K6GGH3_9AGAM|nr:hypothetical protein RSOLAG22IIIB_12791 [Rhizoctonia solani]
MSSRKLSGNKQENYDLWAGKVGLLTEMRELEDVRYNNTPEVRALNALLSNSKTVPKWLGDPESLQYKHFKPKVYRPMISRILRTVGSRFELSDNDPALDEELEECLPLLLLICVSAYRFGSQSTESDKRCYMNALLATLWRTQEPNTFQGSVHSFILRAYLDALRYSQERPLRLPEPASTAAIIPDSSVFFKVGFEHYQGLSRRAIDGCTVLHNYDLKGSKNVLHSVTEYKWNLGLEEARQQVYEGLTTALHQRRALGFTDHFVFGTCHYNQIHLEVVAAIWVSPDDTDNKADPARTPRKVRPPHNENGSQLTGKVQADNALPLTAIEKNSDKGTDVDDISDLHKLEAVHIQGEQQYDDAKLISDLNQRNKIAIYRLGTYCMEEADSMIAFYLLIRGTQALAMEYRKAIMTTSAARIQVMEDARLKLAKLKLFNWYNPPSKSKSHAGSKAGLGSLKEQKDRPPTEGFDSHDSEIDANSDELDSDSYISDSDSDSDSALSLGGDIEEITWEGKVGAFLASSLDDGQQLPYMAHFLERDVAID